MDAAIDFLVKLYELRVSLRRTGLRQRLDRRMLVHVHAALFPNVRLLAMSERSIRTVTLAVAVTHPGTNTHNCCLTYSHLTTWVLVFDFGLDLKSYPIFM